MRSKNWLAIAFAAIVLANLALTILSGLNWNPFHLNFDFEGVAQFGESFGPVGSIMAGVAAVAAYLAYDTQRQELAQAKLDSKEEKKARIRRDFEETFFKMLSQFSKITEDIVLMDYNTKDDVSGRIAIGKIIDQRICRTIREDKISDRDAYRMTYLQLQDKIGHYFSICYIILKFINESEIENKSTYIRTLRANLSNSEILLIALNCAYGGGKEKLKPLVEKYSMLHNVRVSSYNQFQLGAEFDVSAFGDRDMASGEE